MSTAVEAARPCRLARRMLGYTRSQAVALIIMIALIVLLPYVLYPIFLMKVLSYALFACAFNLLLGYSGLLSLGHAAFFGMGSYIAATVLLNCGAPPLLAILAGGAVGAGLGLVFGWIAIRRQGIYFAMITLALSQMVYFFCVEAPFTNGENGIQQVPRGHLFGLIPMARDMNAYWLVAIVFLASFLLIHRVIHSPFGQVLKAIRENEPRAISLGYRTDTYKVLAFVISAGLAGVAGGCNAFIFGIATLNDVHWPMSGEVVLMALVGGVGTVFGPVVGALVVAAMENYLASIGDWVTVLQGLIFILCVVAFRSGLVGELAGRLRIEL